MKCLRSGVCLYCGDPASAHDVELPPALFPVLYRLAQQHAVTPDAPICTECRRATAGAVLTTPGQKRRIVHAAIRRRYASELRTATWDADELEDLGYGLRTAVDGGARQKALQLRRLRWPR
ncbi:MAG: hypothetical protein ACK4NU_00035 [Brevundimonas sp.]